MNNRRFVLLLLTLLLSILSIAQEKRLALVIGNANYRHAGELKNPVNDAKIMAKTLLDLDFDVITTTNASLKEMQKAFSQFVKKLKTYDVALFYYAGHGVQVDGENYLIPVDAKLDEKVQVEFEAFKVASVNKYFAYNDDKLNIIILDACRNNPFRSWGRGLGQGFRAIENQATGTIIAFATREGQTASDGLGKNGLYTKHLVKQMQISQNITDVFQNTRVAVLNESNRAQVPQEWNMLTGNFYFSREENGQNGNELPAPTSPESLDNAGEYGFPVEFVKQRLKTGEAYVKIRRIEQYNGAFRDSAYYQATIVRPDTDRQLIQQDIGGATGMDSRFFSYFKNAVKFKLEDNKTYDVFWEPLEKHLRGIRKVYLIPDGVYHNFNVSALFNPLSRQYLIDELEIQMLRGYEQFLQEPLDNKELTAVLIGAPNYVNADLYSAPGARRAIELIEDIVISQGFKVQKFVGDEATEFNIKNIDAPKILHVSAFANYLPEKDLIAGQYYLGGYSADLLRKQPLLRSALLFRNAQSGKEATGEGVLTPYEIRKLNLVGTSLVVLSAGESGQGSSFSLGNAFLDAGVSCVISPLFKTSDRSRLLVIESFYEKLLRGDYTKNEAFRLAQLEVKKTYKSPVYWGAFTIIGK